MAGVVEMSSVIGGCNFLTSLGSYGERDPNYYAVKHWTGYPENPPTSLMILISIQLLVEFVNR